MEQVNLRIAESAIAGRLNNNPFVQGLLVQCLRHLDKLGRGITSMRGRKPACSGTEDDLVADATLTLSMMSGNQALARELGQCTTGYRLKMEELPHKFSLPNPCLALMFPQQLQDNLALVDQQIVRGPDEPMCRLVLALDHTYLLKSFVQGCVQGKAGILGGPWTPAQPERAFMPFDSMPEDALKGQKAALMLECLVWSPWARVRQSFSIASMPMTLERHKQKDLTLSRQGNLDSWLGLIIFVGLMFFGF